MTVVDYTRLFEPPVLLFVQQSQGGWWSVTDQHGRLFTPPSTLSFCLRFMEAMRDKKHAQLDEDSIEYARCLRIFDEFPSSESVPTAERDGRTSPVPQPVASGEVATDSESFSVRVPMADVIPIGRNT